jgi:hypothetical protein
VSFSVSSSFRLRIRFRKRARRSFDGFLVRDIAVADLPHITHCSHAENTSPPIPLGSKAWVRARRASLALLPQRLRQKHPDLDVRAVVCHSGSEWRMYIKDGDKAGISGACLKTTVETGLAGWACKTRHSPCIAALGLALDGKLDRDLFAKPTRNCRREGTKEKAPPKEGRDQHLGTRGTACLLVA